MIAPADRRDPAPSLHLVRRLRADDAAVRSFLQELPDWPALAQADPARCVDLELLLAEVLNNIVEHAMAGRADGWIEVSVECRPGALALGLTDDGAALPAPLPHRPLPPTSRIDGPAEGGFGWLLIHILADDITYRRVDGLNRLSLRFPMR